jgi:hypothetical protein
MDRNLFGIPAKRASRAAWWMGDSGSLVYRDLKKVEVSRLRPPVFITRVLVWSLMPVKAIVVDLSRTALKNSMDSLSPLKF